MTTGGKTDRAGALRDTVESDPAAVDVDDVVDLLVHGDRETRRTAFDVYETLVTVRPAAVDAVVTRLETHLTDDDADVRRRAALTAGVFAERHPGALERVVPELRSIGDDRTECGREPALIALSKLALERPTGAVAAVETLLDVCHEPVVPVGSPADRVLTTEPDREREAALKLERERRDRVRVHAIAALTRIAADEPTALRDSVSAVADLLEDDHNLVRAAACEVLEAVATEFPGDVEPFAQDLAERAGLDSDHPVPWRAADALVALEDEFPDRVGDAVASIADDLSRFLESRTVERRRIGATLLVDAAAVRPSAVERMVSVLEELLTDDDPFVRSKAVLALGHWYGYRFGGTSTDPEARKARAMLAEIGETDPDEDVRNATSRALDRLDGAENGDE